MSPTAAMPAQAVGPSIGESRSASLFVTVTERVPGELIVKVCDIRMMLRFGAMRQLLHELDLASNNIGGHIVAYARSIQILANDCTLLVEHSSLRTVKQSPHVELYILPL